MDQAPGGERRLLLRIAAQRHLVVLQFTLRDAVNSYSNFAFFFFAGQPGWLSPCSYQLRPLDGASVLSSHRQQTPTVGGGEKILARRQEVVKTLNQQRRFIFSTQHSFDGISCTPSRANHLHQLQAKLIRFLPYYHLTV